MPQNRQCISCKHYRMLHRCTAFPDRIPEAIMLGEHDHRKPYKGDNGIRWELWESVDVETVEA